MSPAPPPTPERPILRYHGGKWVLAPWIISHFPPHRVYVEPFGGAASVLIQKSRAYSEIYNDLDGEIVNLFRALRETPAEMARMVAATPFSRQDYVEAFKETSDPLARALRTLIRSHMGHSGAATHGRSSGFRSFCINSGSHPSTQWSGLPNHLHPIAERFRGVVIEQRDAFELIDASDHELTLFYVDPPYVFDTRDAGTDYRHELSDDAHERLAEKLASLKGMVVLSGYPSELYDRLYRGWHVVTKDARDAVANLCTEVLWINPAAIAATERSRSQPSLFGATPASPESEASRAT